LTVSTPPSLSAQLAEATKALHVQAERSGVIADLLRGRGSVAGYGALMRNLLPVYQALEAGLERHHASPLLAGFVRPEVYRATAIAADLVTLNAEGQPLLPAAIAYAEAVTKAAEGDGILLVAHAYTRTLGDLSGGQILRKLLTNSLGDVAANLAFHEFPAIADPIAFKAQYRADLEIFGTRLADTQPVLNEAVSAFQHNIALSNAVAAQFAISA
jgi:heme oxygenase